MSCAPLLLATNPVALTQVLGVVYRTIPRHLIGKGGLTRATDDTERAGELWHLIVEGDLSAYGLINAVTHFSQNVEDYDRATELEALSGKLSELAPGD